MRHIITLALWIVLLATPAYAGKISDRTAATTPLTGAETIGIIQSGADRKVTVSDLTPSNTVYASSYGVLCNASNDDTAELQAAITANYGKVLILPNGNCLISSAITINAPIVLRGSIGARYNSTNYGTRIYTNTAAINLIEVAQTAGGGNDQRGGIIENLMLDGNSQAAINLNITGAQTVGWTFRNLDIRNATHLGTYAGANHSMNFENVLWTLNGITSNLVTDGGIQLAGINASVITGSRSEANYGTGVLVSAGYNNAWYGGTIEGNQHNGVTGSGTGAHFTLQDVDFETNNESATGSRYDVDVGGAGHWSLENLRFTGTNTTNFIYNHGSQTFIRNCRGMTANKILWTINATGGVFEGDVSNQIDPASNFAILGVIHNTRPLVLQYVTPAVPASTVATTAVPTNIRVYIKTVGDSSAWSYLDQQDTAQAFAAPLYIGQVITLPAGATMKVTYSTTAPTWEWEEIP